MAVGVIGGESVSGGDNANSRGQMRLTHTGRTQKDDIFGWLHETHGGKPVNLPLSIEG